MDLAGRILHEMTWLRLPERILIDGVPVQQLDMRFETYLPRMGQYTPFIARIPGTYEYIIWDGNHAWVEVIDPDEIPRGYTHVPDDWYKHALGLDTDRVTLGA